MSEEREGPPPAGESDVESADLGEPERGGGEEAPGGRPNLDERQERIRTERKAAGPPLEEGEGQEGVAGEEEEPPDVDPEDE